MFEPIECFKCKECGRVYEKIPDRCECRKLAPLVGSTINSFEIKGLINYDKCVATCLLCGLNGEFSIAALRGMVSCGCRPSHIQILNIQQGRITYKCKKCGNASLAHPPIVVYCCDDKD